jgi:CrcB protein
MNSLAEGIGGIVGAFVRCPAFGADWRLPIFLFALGGFAGAIARYRLSAAVSKRFPSLLPYGTLSINALGSLLLGILAGHGFGESARLLLGTGFMGAFTTFSTFKLESVNLAQKRQ